MPGLQLPEWAREFLKKPEEKKKKEKLNKKRILIVKDKSHTNSKRSAWHKNSILDFFKMNTVSNRNKLRHLRAAGVSCPSMNHIKQHFGSFENCIKEAFGFIRLPNEITEEEVIKLCISHNIFSKSDYTRCRKFEPNIFPSESKIIKMFGSFMNLKTIIKSCQKTVLLEQYIALFKSLKKHPTKKDCREHGIDIDYLVSIMSKNQLYDIVDDLTFKMGK